MQGGRGLVSHTKTVSCVRKREEREESLLRIGIGMA